MERKNVEAPMALMFLAGIANGYESSFLMDPVKNTEASSSHCQRKESHMLKKLSSETDDDAVLEPPQIHLQKLNPITGSAGNKRRAVQSQDSSLPKKSQADLTEDEKKAKAREASRKARAIRKTQTSALKQKYESVKAELEVKTKEVQKLRAELLAEHEKNLTTNELRQVLDLLRVTILTVQAQKNVGNLVRAPSSGNCCELSRMVLHSQVHASAAVERPCPADVNKKECPLMDSKIKSLFHKPHRINSSAEKIQTETESILS